MQVFHLHYPLNKEQVYLPSSITIGTFDGLHAGHQALIKNAMQVARMRNLACGVITFDPHPREALGITYYGAYLTPLTEKLLLLEKMGVDVVYIVRFDHSFASLEPEDFIHHFLAPLNCRYITVGYDFTFGRYGAGQLKIYNELVRDIFRSTSFHPLRRNRQKCQAP
ncbi:hypothetical protein [Caldalkalibacillus uzonensis]|nr:hypothetical protein [Caldalkalibacillus uzonensis]